MTRQQTAILTAVAELARLNQRTGASQIAAASGLGVDTVRRVIAGMVADGALSLLPGATVQAGNEYRIPSGKTD